MGIIDHIMTVLGQFAAEVIVLLSVLIDGETVVWFLVGYCRGGGESSVVIYGLVIVHLCIQSLMTNQYLLNE